MRRRVESPCPDRRGAAFSRLPRISPAENWIWSGSSRIYRNAAASWVARFPGKRSAARFGACPAGFGRMARRFSVPDPAAGGLRGDLARQIRLTEVCKRNWRATRKFAALPAPRSRLRRRSAPRRARDRPWRCCPARRRRGGLLRVHLRRISHLLRGRLSDILASDKSQAFPGQGWLLCSGSYAKAAPFWRCLCAAVDAFDELKQEA